MPKHYILTRTAEQDFREARQWSLSRWGKTLTTQYFSDLHDSAEYLSKNHHFLLEKENLTGVAGLGIHAVREHYMIYVAVDNKTVVIVALIRQSRDVPAILKANSYIINRELKEIIDKNH